MLLIALSIPVIVRLAFAFDVTSNPVAPVALLRTTAPVPVLIAVVASVTATEMVLSALEPAPTWKFSFAPAGP